MAARKSQVPLSLICKSDVFDPTLSSDPYTSHHVIIHIMINLLHLKVNDWRCPFIIACLSHHTSGGFHSSIPYTETYLVSYWCSFLRGVDDKPFLKLTQGGATTRSCVCGVQCREKSSIAKYHSLKKCQLNITMTCKHMIYTTFNSLTAKIRVLYFCFLHSKVKCRPSFLVKDSWGFNSTYFK